MDRLSTRLQPARARKSLWTRDDGSIIDRTAPGGRWTPREEVPRLWAECRDRLGDGCYRFKPKLEADGVPPLFAEAERRRAKRAKRKAECGCEAEPAPRARDAGREDRPRIVTGEWFASALGLPEQEAMALKGRSVSLDREAWHALQAVLRTPLAAVDKVQRLQKRRARAWGHDMKRTTAASAAVLARSPVPPISTRCDCETSVIQSARFVHAVDGDDSNTGMLSVIPGIGPVLHAVVKPWRTLAKVSDWLNADVYGFPLPLKPCLTAVGVYLRYGQLWDGTEDAGTGTWSSSTLPPDEYGDLAVLSVVGAKGTGDVVGAKWGRVILGAYGDSTAGLPIIDGNEGGPPQYGDERIGVLVRDCCIFSMSNIKVRGFAVGVDVRGASKDHLYTGLMVEENAVTGLRIGVREQDISLYGERHQLNDDTAAATIADYGLYPQDIIVDSCAFSSNGYDTEGADVALNFMATNCTISNNTMTGDTDRGVDGIVSQDGSSGHLLEDNTIGPHNKYCYVSSTEKTVIVASTTCGGDFVLYQPCDTATGSCKDSGGLGYAISYASTTPAGEEAFAEDGIDLKNVRPRTPTSEETSIIRGNNIFGQNVTKRTGITINDGTTGIHIYNNRICLNSVGILVRNSYNQSQWTVPGPTSHIYIYRNLVYMNQQQGVLIETNEGEDGEYPINNVFLINNTVAHNLLTGVKISNQTDTSTTSFDPDITRVYLYNNLIARNGLLGSYRDEGSNADAMQLAWSGEISLEPGRIIQIGLDYNCYLGWGRETGGGTERVIGVGEGTGFVPLCARDARATWEVEYFGGLQVETLEELVLKSQTALLAAETLVRLGDNLQSFVEDVDLTDPRSYGPVLALSYQPTDAISPVWDAAWSDAGERQGVYHFDGGLIPTALDMSGLSTVGAGPDIGAQEGTVGS